MLLLWMPEKMPDAFANKLLKTIEEPEGEAVLLLVTHDEDEARLLADRVIKMGSQ